jgi:hypothetical protein
MLLNPKEYDPYYEAYIQLVKKEDCVKYLSENLKTVVEFYARIPDKKLNFAYAEGKWTVKDILLHLIDTERIFAYRALRIARNDKTAMEGFNHNDFAISAQAKMRNRAGLISEYISVRTATISLFESFTKEQMKLIGIASNSSISVRAIGFIITGHENHHNTIIKERYL